MIYRFLLEGDADNTVEHKNLRFSLFRLNMSDSYSGKKHIEKEKEIAKKLYGLKAEFYSSADLALKNIDLSFNRIIDDVCPDVIGRSLYEIEEMSARTRFGLMRYEGKTGKAANLKTITEATEKDLLGISNFGKISLNELKSILKRYGLELKA